MSDAASESGASVEVEALLRLLERNRRVFAWKTSGLDENGLRATTAASTMTLGGLVKHVALVEADWLAVKLAGQGYGAPWDTVDFDSDPDWEWRTGARDAPEEVYALWRAAVDRSRGIVDEVVRERGLDGAASYTWPDGGRRRCGTCCWTWSRSTRGTSGTPTFFARPWTVGWVRTRPGTSPSDRRGRRTVGRRIRWPPRGWRRGPGR